MRTYNPALEKTLEQWGVLALPKQYERERLTQVRRLEALKARGEYQRLIESYAQ